MAKFRAIVHCSASEWGTAIIIDRWHRERGWTGIGYHHVIENGYPTADHYRIKTLPNGKKGRTRIRLLNGQVSSGRPYDADPVVEANEIGAHAYGHNRDTLGVCLVGDKRFTRNQIISLIRVLELWRDQFGLVVDDILGHYEVDTKGKTCPNMDMNIVRRLVGNKMEAAKLIDSLNPKE